MALLPLVLTGCFKFTMDIEINGDDTVSGTAVAGLSSELQAFAEAGDDSNTTNAFRDIDGVVSAEFDDGQFVGQSYAFDAIPIEAFALRDEARVLTITRDGDTLIVDGALNFEDPNAGGPGDLGFAQAFFDAADIRVTIKFPGEILETNGEIDQDTNTVTWYPQYGLNNTLSAVVLAPPGSDTWVWWVIGGGVVLTIAVAVFVLARPKPTASSLDDIESFSTDDKQ
jgi:hypothetical protein